jgi:hypothetical protein
MRIQVRLPKIQPHTYDLLEQCPYEGCHGDTFKPHGRKGEAKSVRDTDHEQVKARRHRCSICGRTFRVYPTGVSQDPFVHGSFAVCGFYSRPMLAKCSE